MKRLAPSSEFDNVLIHIDCALSQSPRILGALMMVYGLKIFVSLIYNWDFLLYSQLSVVQALILALCAVNPVLGAHR